MKQRKGFTLVEGLFILLLTSVALALTFPMVTKLSATKSNLDNHAVDCIEKDSSEGCDAALKGALYEREKSFNTLYKYLNEDDATNETKALKLLKQACLEGSTSSCDVFIDRCVQDKTDELKVCDIPSGSNKDYDLRSLLEIDYLPIKTGSTYEAGKIYLVKAITSRCNQRVENILRVTRETCLDGNNNMIACNIDNINCKPDTNEAIVEGCNDGNKDYCTLGYQKNINRTCSDILDAIPTSLNGTYSLSRNTSGDYYKAYCDMEGGGWTLLVKADGDQGTFRYDNTNWTDTNEYQASETNLNHTEHKSKAFAYVPFKQIKLRLVTPIAACGGVTSCHGSTKVTCIKSCSYNVGFGQSAVTTDLIFSKTNNSALEMFTTNDFYELDLIKEYKGYDDDDFMLTTMPDSQLENTYFEIGINSQSSLYGCSGQKFTSARIGIIASNVNKSGGSNCTVKGLPKIGGGSFDRCSECASNEFSSAIGIGLYNSGSSITAGNYYLDGSNSKSSFGYLFVK